MHSEFSMQGKVALVTGASSGFGAHFCRQPAARGAAVVACARRVDRLESLVADIEAAGGRALAVAMDVTDRASVEAGFDAAEQAFGAVTVVANNAGVAETKAALEIDEAGWDYVMDANLKAVWGVAQTAARRMVAVGSGGSIVNIASILGLAVGAGLSTYAISKAGVVQLTKALALEFGRANIRVNAICPGYFVTEMNQAFFASQRGQDYIKTTSAGRTGELDEMTAPFLLLASDAGAFINGVALPVDGGHLLGGL